MGSIPLDISAALVPATAQTTPGIVNKALVVGTVGYGVIEAGDGNFYAMSLPNPNQNHCADSSNLYCAYIYKTTKRHPLNLPLLPGSQLNGSESGKR